MNSSLIFEAMYQFSYQGIGSYAFALSFSANLIPNSYMTQHSIAPCLICRYCFQFLKRGMVTRENVIYCSLPKSNLLSTINVAYVPGEWKEAYQFGKRKFISQDQKLFWGWIMHKVIKKKCAKVFPPISMDTWLALAQWYWGELGTPFALPFHCRCYHLRESNTGFFRPPYLSNPWCISMTKPVSLRSSHLSHYDMAKQ